MDFEILINLTLNQKAKAFGLVMVVIKPLKKYSKLFK